MLATAKIHILKQFTTCSTGGCCSTRLCLLLQRYTFWSNSQLFVFWRLLIRNCACYCKDTHFEAIHNLLNRRLLLDRIVLATAKIHILKQFTTCGNIDINLLTLCLLLQRYTFWSNSQLLTLLSMFVRNCACYCKDTHFEAIHNFDRHDCCLSWIVLATAKIHILKQFTTFQPILCDYLSLCLLLQRYTFWSNSQPLSVWTNFLLYCACYCKDTHFEAIHNTAATRNGSTLIVLATAKIHILKQFTTYGEWQWNDR